MLNKQFSFIKFHSLIIILLVLGIFFRFVNLDKKVFWIDEVHSVVRIVGYTRTEFVQQLSQGQILSIEDLQRYQKLSPERGFSDSIKALGGNPEHSPLYYVLARFWMQGFSSPVIATRSLSAVISLLAFPCLYWLCLELFASPLTGWIAIALMTVSPFHVLYAQEAREYSLWAVAILLSSAALLWAIRPSDRKFPISKWVVYATTVALGLYSHLLFLLVILVHGIYLVSTISFRDEKARVIVVKYILATLAGVLAFLPWLLLFINDSDGIGGWVAKKTPITTLIQRWAINLSSLFFDVQISYPERLFDIESVNDSVKLGYGTISIILLIVTLISYSAYFLYKKTKKQTWLLIFTLISIPGLIMVLPDLISGGQRSTIGRFLTPCYLGIQLAVAYLLTAKITANFVKLWQQKFWQLLLVILLSLGVVSCAIASQAETWWNKYSSYDNPQLAQRINQAPSPLIISGPEKASRLTSLSYELKPNVRFFLTENPNEMKIPDSVSTIFLFRPSTEFIQALETQQGYKVQPIPPLVHLWQLVK